MTQSETLESSPNRPDLHAPNFIGIGPGKCGTTWLYKACKDHPQVCMASAKETLYFDDYYHKGIDWYLNLFRNCKCPEETQHHAIGEVSNSYVFSPMAANRIADVFPDVKIIYNLRDPIERAFSHYLLMMRNGLVNGSFEDSIVQRPDLLSRGKYAEHLTPYFDRFPESQRLGLFFDDLKHDANAYAGSVFRFLGVDPALYQGDASKRVFAAATPRSRILSKLFLSAGAITRKLGYPNLVTKIKYSILERLLFREYADGEVPVLNPDTRERLKEYFFPDLEKLKHMTGRDVLSLWDF